LGLIQTRVILNAVNLDMFRPAPRDDGLLEELGIDPGAVVIAFLGNLHDRKRPLDIVRSSPAVLSRCPLVVYVVIGEGALREEMVRTSRTLGVEGRFRFVDWRSYEQVPRHINMADIVVLPSFGEGLARVYLETQACGRVLIASDIAPAREVIEDGTTGLLFPVGDVERLAARCIQAAQDRDLRARIGHAARARVQRHHDMAAAVSQYLAAFDALLGRDRFS